MTWITDTDERKGRERREEERIRWTEKKKMLMSVEETYLEIKNKAKVKKKKKKESDWFERPSRLSKTRQNSPNASLSAVLPWAHQLHSLSGRYNKSTDFHELTECTKEIRVLWT